jgi:hypothetical protein
MSKISTAVLGSRQSNAQIEQGKRKDCTDMITTNIASASDPLTYTRLREECEKLLQLAKELEGKTLENRETFAGGQEFLQLKGALRAQNMSVQSIICCL